MFLRAAALGLRGGTWRGVLQRLQQDLPQLALENARLDTPDTLTQLLGPQAAEYWALQPADVLFCSTNPLLEPNLRILEALQRLGAFVPKMRLVLLLAGAEKPLRTLMQHSTMAIQFCLSTGERWQCSDANLLLGEKAQPIPPLPQHAHPTQLLWKPVFAAQTQQEVVRAEKGWMIGFSQLQAIQDDQGKVWPPKEWLRRILKHQDQAAPWRWRHVGFVRSNQGWRLHPGLPLQQIQEIIAAPTKRRWQSMDTAERVIHFKSLVNLKQLDQHSPWWQQLLKHIHQQATALGERKRQLERHLRLAAARKDLPCQLVGGTPLLTQTVVQSLNQQGFKRCDIQPQKQPAYPHEATLRLALGDLGNTQLAPSLAPTQTLAWQQTFHTALQKLDELLDWRQIPPSQVLTHHPPQPPAPSPQPKGPQPKGHQRYQTLAQALARWEKAREDWRLATMQMKLYRQEARLLQRGIQHASELLTGPHAAHLWQPKQHQTTPTGQPTSSLSSQHAKNHPRSQAQPTLPAPAKPPSRASTPAAEKTFLQRQQAPHQAIWEDAPPISSAAATLRANAAQITPNNTLDEARNEANPAVNRPAPPLPEEALVFSMEEEEALEMLRSLGRYPKRFWVNLRLAAQPQGLANLNIEQLSQWQTAWISPRTKARIAQSAQQAQADLKTAWQALQQYHQQAQQARSHAKQYLQQVQSLGRDWVQHAVETVFKTQHPQFVQAVDQALTKHERSWLARSLIHRVWVFCSQPNHVAVWKKTLKKIYPGLMTEQCYVEALVLNTATSSPARPAAKPKTPQEIKPSPPFPKTLLHAAIQQALKNAGQNTRPDLIIIEHHSALALGLLNALQRQPALRGCAQLVFSADAWSPAKPNAAMPWPYTRVQWLPRLAPLEAEHCVTRLMGLHPTLGSPAKP